MNVSIFAEKRPSTDSFEDQLGSEIGASLFRGEAGCSRVERKSPSQRLPNLPAALSRYRLIKKIGSGGMGVVYSAHDLKLDRHVAIKLLSPGIQGTRGPRYERRLMREAQALARLNHPNVVTVYEAGESDGLVFVVMELIVGSSLGHWLDVSDPDWRMVLERFIQAGEGVAAAHSVGIVHRDLKPSNMLIGTDGRVSVADFGIAWISGSGHEEFVETIDIDGSESSDTRDGLTRLTRVGGCVGTPGYMSPEQFMGAVPTPASDQFGFCVALYRALYRVPPFAGRGEDLEREVCSGRLRELPTDTRVPTWIGRVLVRGLSRDPGERWESMAMLLRKLRSDPVARRRRRARWFTGITLIVSVILVLAWYARTRNTDAIVAEDMRDDALAEARRNARRAEANAELAKKNERKAFDVVRFMAAAGAGENASIRAALLREVEEPAQINGWREHAWTVLHGAQPKRTFLIGADVIDATFFDEERGVVGYGFNTGTVVWRFIDGQYRRVFEAAHVPELDGMMPVSVTPDSRYLVFAPTAGSVRERNSMEIWDLRDPGQPRLVDSGSKLRWWSPGSFTGNAWTVRPSYDWGTDYFYNSASHVSVLPDKGGKVDVLEIERDPYGIIVSYELWRRTRVPAGRFSHAIISDRADALVAARDRGEVVRFRVNRVAHDRGLRARPLGSVDGRVTKLAMSPDGNQVVVLSDDGQVLHWREGSGAMRLGELAKLNKVARRARFSASGEKLAVWNAEELFVFHHIDTADKFFREDIDINDRISGEPMFTRDGQRLLICHSAGDCQIVELEERITGRVNGHTRAVEHLEVSPDGDWLVASTRGGGSLLQRLDRKPYPIAVPSRSHGEAAPDDSTPMERLGPNFDSRGRRALLCSFETCKVIDLSTEEEIEIKLNDLRATFERGGDPEEASPQIDEIRFSSDGNALLIVSQRRLYRLRFTPELNTKLLVETHQGKRLSLDNSAELAVVREWHDSEVPTVLLGPSGVVTHEVPSPGGSWQSSAWSPTTRQLALVSRQGGAIIWRPDSHVNSLVEVTNSPINVATTIVPSDERPVAFDPAGRWLAVRIDDGSIWLWLLNGRSEQPVELRSRSGVDSFRFSPDGGMVAGLGRDGIVMWDISTLVPGDVLPSGIRISRERAGRSVTSQAFTPDGRWLLAGQSDGTLRAFNTQFERSVGVLHCLLWTWTDYCLPEADRMARLYETAREARRGYARCRERVVDPPVRACTTSKEGSK